MISKSDRFHAVLQHFNKELHYEFILRKELDKSFNYEISFT